MYQRQDYRGPTVHLSDLSHILRFISIRESGKLCFVTYYVLEKKWLIVLSVFGVIHAIRKAICTVGKRDLVGYDAIAKC